MKGKLAHVANYGNVVYASIKKQPGIIKLIMAFLVELGITNFDFLFEKKKKETVTEYDFSKYLDEYRFFENKDFKIHTIFGKNYTHFIVITKKREELLKVLTKDFKFVKLRK
ncbi:MAG: hypothetical protein NTY99_02695 [DPANN group archaeon]|nr:hypothetical protein [DPANN group archaeon]